MIGLVVSGVVFIPHPKPIPVTPAIHAFRHDILRLPRSRAGETATRAAHNRENGVQFPGPQPASHVRQ